MRLDLEILDGPAEAGARILALARLADAEDALVALADPDRRGAFPTFGGALRRLGDALQAGAPALAGAIPPERLVRLEALGRSCAAGHDAEVVAEWLDQVRGELPGPYRGALDWLADRVERRRRGAAEDGPGAVRRFRRLAARLRADLGASRSAPPARRPDVPAALAPVLAAALRARTRALREAILAVAGSAGAAGLARVLEEAGRLGDLLEPLRASAPSSHAAIDAVRALHGAVLDWQRASAAERALDAALLEARAEEVRRGDGAVAGLRPGLLALLRLAQDRSATAWGRIAAEHLPTRASAATDAAYAVVAALESEGEEGAERPPPHAAERRFLLTAIPPEGRGGDVEELEQGWLPGDGRESIGVARSPAGERWFRVRAAVRGRPDRVEPLGRAEFETFWPLTSGRRLAKRRHRAAAAPGWRFDEYLDRPLVLAVAGEGGVEAAPAWLEAVLVREVSGERGYLDEALARRSARRAG